MLMSTIGNSVSYEAIWGTLSETRFAHAKKKKNEKANNT